MDYQYFVVYVCRYPITIKDARSQGMPRVGIAWKFLEIIFNPQDGAPVMFVGL